MIKSVLLTIFALLAATANAADKIKLEEATMEDVNNALEDLPALRGKANVDPKDSRDLLFLCNAIESMFEEDEIACSCNYRWLFGELRFRCVYKEYRCSKNAPATKGEVCAVPTVQGRFNWFLLQLRYTATAQICNTNSWANNTYGGDFFMGDLCIDMTVQSGLTVPTGIQSCGADFFGVSCDSCKRCKYDIPKTNRTGISMKCSNAQVDPCFPIEIPIFVTDAREAKTRFQPVQLVREIVQNDMLMSSLLMKKADELVEEYRRRN